MYILISQYDDLKQQATEFNAIPSTTPILRYLKNSGDDEYDFVVLADIQRVTFEHNSFTEMMNILTDTDGESDGAFYMGFAPKKLSNPSRITSLFGTENKGIKAEIYRCFSPAVSQKTIEWMQSLMVETKATLITGNKHMIIKYLDELIHESNADMNAQTNSDCGEAMRIVSLANFCGGTARCSAVKQ